MLNKRIIGLAVLLVALIAMGTAAAAENITGDAVGLEDTAQGIDSDANDLENVNVSGGREILASGESQDNLSLENDAVVLNATDDNSLVSKSDSNDSVLSAGANVYLNNVVTPYNSGKYYYLGWSGYFSGYFKVYRGSSLYHSEYISGYNKDLQWSLEGMSPGYYTTKFITYSGSTLGIGKIVIKKSSSVIRVNSFKARAGSIFYCYAYVKDKYTGRNYNGGTVYFKINGKTYRAKLSNGVAVAKIRIPNKIKSYICTATFSGGSNVYGGSTKFKMVVVKKAQARYKIITTKAKSYWITKRLGAYTVKTIIYDMTAGCMAPYKYIDTFLYKNGRMVRNSAYYVNYGVNGAWSGWTQYITSTSHHRHAVYDGARVGLIKVKFRI